MGIHKLVQVLISALVILYPMVLSASSPDEAVEQLIIKYRSDYQARMTTYQTQARTVETISNTTGLSVSYKRPMSPSIGAHVVKLPYPMSSTEAQAYAKQVMQANPDVEYVELDRRRYSKLIPSDTLQSQQWSIQSSNDFPGASNIYKAWDISTGSGAIAAILDSGHRPHADLIGNIIGQYDMISFDQNGDGNGRDADARDTGLANDERDSSWHGTHVSGVVAAKGNNGKGIAGTAFNSSLLSVRILGPDGGFLSDQVDAMLWAAGEPIAGIPTNSDIANVINLSIGTNQVESCTRSEQNAINLLRSKGIVVVVSSGNENRNVAGSAPANCDGVITATAVTRDGARAFFSNFGQINDIAAPGYQILSTSNKGLTAPVATSAGDTYTYLTGTSLSAPHVTGVVSLMFSANANFRNGVINKGDIPDIIEKKIKQSARAFPDNINGASQPQGCNLDSQQNCRCTTNTCGAGILDAYQALVAVTTQPIANAGNSQTAAAGEKITLDGSGSSDDVYNQNVLGTPDLKYSWRQTAGYPVDLSNDQARITFFNAPEVSGTTHLKFELTVTDDTGLTSAPENVTIIVQSGNINQEDLDNVQKAYIAYYGRPADPAGLDYWAGQLSDNGGDLSGIVSQFGASAEYTNRFSDSEPDTLVNNIYQFLFNRDADAAGLAYYSQRLTSGTTTLSEIALQVINGATGADTAIVESKIDVAHYLTTNVRTSTKTYSGSDIPVLTDILANVDGSDTSVESANDQVDNWLTETTNG